MQRGRVCCAIQTDSCLAYKHLDERVSDAMHSVFFVLFFVFYTSPPEARSVQRKKTLEMYNNLLYVSENI